MSGKPAYHGWTHRPKARGGTDPVPPTEAHYEIKVFSDTGIMSTGNGKFIFAIPDDLDGWYFIDADAFVTTVSSSGAPTVMIRNATDAVDVLSTAITIDASEFTSYTAATQPVINAANDQVATADLIAIDVDGIGTGAKGLGVILTLSDVAL
jgi:hypothetical protein